MWSSLSALLSLALACSPAPSAERAYLAALDELEGCAELPPSDLRGECVSMAARALARQGDAAAAQAACASEGLGRWQGECWFLIADSLQATAALAESLCERAGPHRRQCLGHAAAREAQALLATPGSERAALATLESRVARYRPGPRAREEAWALLVRRRASEAPGQPFSAAMCGELDVWQCSEILTARLGPAGVCAPAPGQVAADAGEVLAAAQARCAEAGP